jgi:hypothetical protein
MTLPHDDDQPIRRHACDSGQHPVQGPEREAG